MSSRKENEGHLIQRVNRYVSALGKCLVVNSNTRIDFLLSVLSKHRYLSFIKDVLLMLSHISSYASSSHAALPWPVRSSMRCARKTRPAAVSWCTLVSQGARGLPLSSAAQ